MQVLYLTPRYLPQLSGAEHAAHGFASGLVAAGHEVVVVTSTEGPKGQRTGRTLDGVRVLHARMEPDVGRLIAKHKPDVVLAQLSWIAKVAEWRRAVSTGPPIVGLLHAAGEAARLAKNGHHLDIDLLVFPTRAAASEAPRGARVAVVPPPIDPERVVPNVRDGGSVAMVNVSARKGASVLWWLAERHPERKFLAVKGGHSKQDVRDAANVEVLGPVFGPVFGMRDIYRRTRVLLMPTRAETFGLVGVEAQMCGIPVICSDLPALREALGDGAVYVSRGDTTGWSEALESLDAEEDYEAASARSLANAARYDTVASVSALEAAIANTGEDLPMSAESRCPAPQEAKTVGVSDEPIVCSLGGPGQSGYAAALVSELGFRSVPLGEVEPYLAAGRPVLVNGWWPEFAPFVQRYHGLFHVVWHSGWAGSDLMGEAGSLDTVFQLFRDGAIHLHWLERRDVVPPGVSHLTPIWSPSGLERMLSERPEKRPGAVLAGVHGQYPTAPKNILATVQGAAASGGEVHVGQSSLTGRSGQLLAAALKGKPHVVHQTLPRPEMLRLIASMEVVVHPSFSETWPVLVLEAVTLGTPVVTSDATAWVCDMDPEIAALCVVRPATATGQIASLTRHLLASPEDRARVLAEQQRVLADLCPEHMDAAVDEFRAAGFSVTPRSERVDDLTVFVLTTGEPSTDECLALLRAQDMDFRLDVIENVAPMNAAFQAMLDRCETPYFVQVDADMLLARQDAIRELYDAIRVQPPNVALYVGWLWDSSFPWDDRTKPAGRPIQGIKIYRHDICARYPYEESLSCEVTQLQRMEAEGFVHVSAPILNGIDGCVGVHHGCQTPRLAYARWFSLAQKHVRLRWMGWIAEHAPYLSRQFLDNPSAINRAALLGAADGMVSEAEERERDFRESQDGFDRLWALFGEGADPDAYVGTAAEIMSTARTDIETRVENLPTVDDPVSATLYLTSRCTNKCTFCARQLTGRVDGDGGWIAPGEDAARPDMEPALVESLLATFPTIRGACLAGFGEPLLHPDLGAIIDVLHAHDVVAGLITNGALLTKRAAEVEAWPLAYLSVSLYGTTAAEHAEVTQAGGWPSVVEGIQHFAQNTETRTGISWVTHRGNVEHVPEVLRLAAEWGVQFVHLVNLLPHGDPDDAWFAANVLTVGSPEMAQLDAFHDLPGGELVEVWPTPISLTEPPPRKCRSPFTTLGVNSWGHTSLCQRVEPPIVYHGDHFQLDGAWRNDPNTRLRQAMRGDLPLPAKCARCFGCWSG